MTVLPLDQPANERLVRIVSLIAIVLGICVRTIYFRDMPPGLNQDEASIGYDTWSLLHFGIDRNGVSWPIHLVAWGDGQNALYAYMAMPFVAFGLSPLTVRLPMLFSALASLWLVWIIADRLFDRRTAWGTTAIVALCPWHIMLARWGLESNILPFVFLCGFACLMLAQDERRRTGWLSAACACFGVSLYAYGSAYLAVPVFVFLTLLIGLLYKTYTFRQTIIAGCTFALVALPIALFLAVNTFGWSSLVVAGITIPRMPVTPRFHSQLADGALVHIPQLWHLLSTQSDGMVYNVTDPYGVLYSSIFFVVAIALAIATIVFGIRRDWPPQRMLLAVWLIAALPIGFVQAPNINRINLLLMNLVLCAGIAVCVIDARIRGALVVTLTIVLGLFALFTRDYFTTQRDQIALWFSEGLVPALQYAKAHSTPEDPICLTGAINAPYIFVLFSEETDPREYLRTVRYINEDSQSRQVVALGRHTIGLERCMFDSAKFVIARPKEIIPQVFDEHRTFGYFNVYARH